MFTKKDVKEYNCPNCDNDKPEYREPCPKCEYEDKKIDLNQIEQKLKVDFK